jgi:fructose-bisphosphate aldolase class 1
MTTEEKDCNCHKSCGFTQIDSQRLRDLHDNCSIQKTKFIEMEKHIYDISGKSDKLIEMIAERLDKLITVISREGVVPIIILKYIVISFIVMLVSVTVGIDGLKTLMEALKN